MTLYQDIKAAGISINNHESDLYFPVTPESIEILALYPDQSSSQFVSNTDGQLWFDAPFAYEPFWDAKQDASSRPDRGG